MKICCSQCYSNGNAQCAGSHKDTGQRCAVLCHREGYFAAPYMKQGIPDAEEKQTEVRKRGQTGSYGNEHTTKNGSSVGITQPVCQVPQRGLQGKRKDGVQHKKYEWFRKHRLPEH